MSAHFEKVTFQSGKETLSGTIARKSPADMPSFLFLHGAGSADQTRAYYLMEGLFSYGISSFGFDFSGHGNSTGKLYQSSLKKRVDEASSAIQYLASEKPIAVYGSSMGGHIAIRLLEKFRNIRTLVLFAPGIYDRRAYELPFGKGFSDVIREKESWINSEIFSILEKFTGNLLVFIGEKDAIIPHGVIELLDKYSSHAAKKEIVWIPECNHAIHAWISKRPQLAKQTIEKISEFV